MDRNGCPLDPSVFSSELTLICVWGQSGKRTGASGTLAAAPVGEGSCPCTHLVHMGTLRGHPSTRFRERSTCLSVEKSAPGNPARL